MNKQTRSVHINAELHTKLKIEATKKGITLAELINKLLEKAMEDKENGQEVD